VDPVVAEVARNWDMSQTKGGLRVVAVHGEDRTLVMQVQLGPEASNVLRASDVAAMIADGICSNPRNDHFFTEGRTVRAEVSVAGGPQTSATTGRCSGPIGQAGSIEVYVITYRRLLGRDLGDGTVLTAARAEGQMLVLVMDGPPGWRARLYPDGVDQGFLGGFCQGGRSSFFDGRTLRVDTTEAGANPMRGQVLTACPASASRGQPRPEADTRP
jgi:hypothetical protein